jgi:hypothetical protein
VKRALSQAVAASPTLRAVAVPTYRAYARHFRSSPGARVLANGIPKGGTHLLTTLLDAFPGLSFSGYQETLTTFRRTPFLRASYDDADVDWTALRRRLSKIPSGEYAAAHFPFAPSLQSVLDELEIRHVVILRDPRDIVISDAAYIRGNRRHAHNRRISALSRAEAVSFVITGFRNDDGTVGLGSIADRVANYARWMQQPGALVCRFEDIIGAAGGGDDGLQFAAIEAIGRHIGRPLSATAVERIAVKVWDPQSHTFRAGRTGGWREVLDSAQRDLFKEIAGEWLIRLGYERDRSW